MPLTDTRIKALKPKAKKYKMADERGLWIAVFPNGSKRWLFVFRLHGKQREAGLGTYPAISLKQARSFRDEMRSQVAEGVDPVAARKASKVAQKAALENTFEAIFREWYKRDIEGKMAPKTCQKISNIMGSYVLPSLGKTPIAEIGVAEVHYCLRAIQDRGLKETPSKAKSYISKVFRYAAPMGLVDSDPTALLRDVIKREKGTHAAAITDPKNVGRLMLAIDEYQGKSPTVPVALKLSALWLMRPGEIRKLEWSSVNWEKKRLEFTVTKTGKSKSQAQNEMLVPLARQALTLLKEIHCFTGHGRYVFPSARGMGRPMSENAVRVALRTLGFSSNEMSAQGFRAMGRTLLDEELREPVELIEAALSHTVKDPLGRAYNRTTHIEARSSMMQRWADYLDLLREDASGGNFIEAKFGT
ncbi:tyrosine-type recombinase/integrase [Microbulbifer mangrovi]|uniref:tyrosine-type recombinase/integrase n=1 Tax=Microbulbifer mangrovi TaxID=927787 RepID=UPI0009903C32|nr:integrase arm-type DNA-binding domain-containing protein [Microbulbifer mangrovi]